MGVKKQANPRQDENSFQVERGTGQRGGSLEKSRTSFSAPSSSSVSDISSNSCSNILDVSIDYSYIALLKTAKLCCLRRNIKSHGPSCEWQARKPMRGCQISMKGMNIDTMLAQCDKKKDIKSPI